MPALVVANALGYHDKSITRLRNEVGGTWSRYASGDHLLHQRAGSPGYWRQLYSSYYRQMLPPLLRTLGFRCNNTAYRPVMDALALLEKYASVDGKTHFYDAGDTVPMDGVVRKDWREAVVDDKGRVERIPYELCVLVALRDAIRRREIYIEGAARWRNPEDDLPGDFEATRTVHYAAIRQPLDARECITDLKQRMTNGLDRLTAALTDGSAGGVKVTTRHSEPWISVPKLEKLDEPTGLQALKDEVVRRWGVLDLLDVLKNADFDTGFTDEFASVAAYERIDRAVLQRRLLLALFALGTNMGIRAIVATGEHGESEAALRHVRRHFITVDNLRAAVRKLVNATFAARDTAWWGQGTACASDSKKFGSWSSNFMTEYHARYGGQRRDDLLACGAEERSASTPSSKSCSSSEVAAMIEGLLPALHGHRGCPSWNYRRHARRIGGRVRLHRVAQLPSAAEAEEHRQHPPCTARTTPHPQAGRRSAPR
ncbi:hypothetical protein SVIOM74S_07222 [Streptomyces violarus]